MRKIVSKKEKAKKKKRNQFIAGGVLIVVMLFSVIGYSFKGSGSGGNKKITYNGFEFLKENDLWRLTLGNFNFMFYYNPNEVEEISANIEDISNYYQQTLYLSSESNSASSEIYQNLNQIVLRTQNACYQEQECGDNLPVKGCENNFIIIEKSNQTKIEQQENCVFIQGEEGDLMKLTDEFLFQILGIRG